MNTLIVLFQIFAETFFDSALLVIVILDLVSAWHLLFSVTVLIGAEIGWDRGHIPQ